MMRYNNLTVNTTAVQVPIGEGDAPVLVNSGTTNIYFGNTDDVTSSNGILLAPGIGYEFARTLGEAGWDALWVVGDGAGGEVRYGSVG
jgi:hypothetical protein